MKYIFAILLFIASFCSVFAQSEATTGGESPMTPELIDELRDQPDLELTPASLATPLPDYVDNSTQPYFITPFQQYGWSCVYAAEVKYTFTYEINRVRGVETNVYDSTTWYPTSFGWNFKNEGRLHNGAPPCHGFKLLKYMGYPNAETWGEPIKDTLKWMTGYEKYEAAMYNRIKEYYRIPNLNTPEGLNVLKHWLNDHNEGGDAIGGVAVFSTPINIFNEKQKLTNDSYDAGKYILTDMKNNSSGHRMTIVGYNDLVKFDFDSSGTYSDWEIGALKVANSAGPNWIDSGYVYWPYWMIEGNTLGQQTIRDYEAWCIEVDNEYEPKAVLRFKASTDNRKGIQDLFYGNTKSTDAPNSLNHKRVFFDQLEVSEVPILGNSYDPLEASVDITHIINNKFSRKHFLLLNPHCRVCNVSL